MSERPVPVETTAHNAAAAKSRGAPEAHPVATDALRATASYFTVAPVFLQTGAEAALNPEVLDSAA